MFLFVFGESLRDISLSQIVSPQKLIRLSKDIERLPGIMGQKRNDRSPCSIENSPVIKDDLGSYKHTGHFSYVVAYFVVIDQMASDAVQD